MLTKIVRNVSIDQMLDCVPEHDYNFSFGLREITFCYGVIRFFDIEILRLHIGFGHVFTALVFFDNKSRRKSDEDTLIGVHVDCFRAGSGDLILTEIVWSRRYVIMKVFQMFRSFKHIL